MSHAVALINPWVQRNVSDCLRVANCHGADLLMTGNRVEINNSTKGARLPREERMREYSKIIPTERPIDERPDLTPVAVECFDGAESLHYFEHPENALYIFGEEDGDLRSRTGLLAACHRFLFIPTRHCLNLATAVGIVLADRHKQRVLAGAEEPFDLVGRKDMELR